MTRENLYRLCIALLILAGCGRRENSSDAQHSAEAVARGHQLFLQHCAICHGERGDGEGIRKMGLSTTPRNFSDSSWQSRTPSPQIFKTIRDGKSGTSMPAFPSLDGRQIGDLVAYIRSLGPSP